MGVVVKKYKDYMKFDEIYFYNFVSFEHRFGPGIG